MTAVATVPTRIGGAHVRRLAPLSYSFTGFVDATPGKVLSLYRVTRDGRSVLTAQARPAGEHYRFTRTFTSPGEHGFYVAAKDDVDSRGGRSAVQAVLIR